VTSSSELTRRAFVSLSAGAWMLASNLRRVLAQDGPHMPDKHEKDPRNDKEKPPVYGERGSEVKASPPKWADPTRSWSEEYVAARIPSDVRQAFYPNELEERLASNIKALDRPDRTLDVRQVLRLRNQASDTLDQAQTVANDYHLLDQPGTLAAAGVTLGVGMVIVAGAASTGPGGLTAVGGAIGLAKLVSRVTAKAVVYSVVEARREPGAAPLRGIADVAVDELRQQVDLAEKGLRVGQHLGRVARDWSEIRLGLFERSLSSWIVGRSSDPTYHP
jgi:hypothetical protein